MICCRFVEKLQNIGMGHTVFFAVGKKKLVGHTVVFAVGKKNLEIFSILACLAKQILRLQGKKNLTKKSEKSLAKKQ